MNFEARAREFVESDRFTALMGCSVKNLGIGSYLAGFEAGLKARMPSDEEINDANDEYADDSHLNDFKKGAKWLAANMRKGE